MKYFLLLIMLTISILSFTQNINPPQILIKNADSFLENDKAEAANRIYKTLIQDFAKSDFPDSTKAYIFSQYAISFGYQSDWKNALKYSHQAITIYKKSLGENHTKTIDEYYNLGYAHSALEDFDSLSFYWLKCVKLYEQKDNSYHNIALVYNNLGSNFRNQTYYYKAYNFFKKAVENWEKVADKRANYLAIGYDNLGAILDNPDGIYYLQKALNIKLKIGENPFRSYIEIGSKYQNLEQFNQALFYYEEGLKYLQAAIKNPPKKDFAYQYDLALTYSLISGLYESQADYETAISYLNKAIDLTVIENYSIKNTQFLIRKANILSKQGKHEVALESLKSLFENIDKSPLFGYLTNTLAGVYAAQKDFKNALVINQLSIDFNLSRSHSKQPQNFLKRFDGNKFPLTTNAAISISNHSKYLNDYAALFINNKTKQIEILKIALYNIDEAILLFQQIQDRTTDFLYAKRKFNEAIIRQQEILFALAKLTNKNQYLEQAFTVAEIGKFNTTLVNFNTLKIEEITTVPQELLIKEKHLKIEIGQIKDEIYYVEQGSKNPNDENIRKQYDKLFELNKKYKNLLQTYQKSYSNYYKTRHKIEPVHIIEIQNSLDNSTVLVNYYIGESHIFIYEITSNSFDAQKIEKPENFEENIQNYRKNLQDFTSDISEIKNQGQAFYDLLLKSTLEKHPNQQNLLVIPNQELSTIPFETFVNESEYLVQNHPIHYAYSATLWQQQKTLKRKKSKQIWAGFAPTYDNFAIAEKDTFSNNLLANYIRNNQLSLQGTQTEIEQINELVKGKTYFDKAANKRNFKAIASDFQVLHLAMHALLEDENPMYSKLLFTQENESKSNNGFLTISELYNLELNADLAVLSACNTGFGKLQPGEGVLSLSQAFTAAGCPSTLATLWQIPDAETSDLMIDFYKQLKVGKTKREALQLAKQNYLETASNSRAKHPYFWAGFLLSGDEKAIKLQKNWSIWWWIFLPIIIISFIIIGKRNRQNKENV